MEVTTYERALRRDIDKNAIASNNNRCLNRELPACDKKIFDSILNLKTIPPYKDIKYLNPGPHLNLKEQTTKIENKELFKHENSEEKRTKLYTGYMTQQNNLHHSIKGINSHVRRCSTTDVSPLKKNIKTGNCASNDASCLTLINFDKHVIPRKIPDFKKTNKNKKYIKKILIDHWQIDTQLSCKVNKNKRKTCRKLKIQNDAFASENNHPIIKTNSKRIGNKVKKPDNNKQVTKIILLNDDELEDTAKKMEKTESVKQGVSDRESNSHCLKGYTESSICTVDKNTKLNVEKNYDESIKSDISEPVSEIRLLSIDYDLQEITDEIHRNKSTDTNEEIAKSTLSKSKSNKNVAEARRLMPMHALHKSDDKVAKAVDDDDEFLITNNGLQVSESFVVKDDVINCGEPNSGNNEYLSRDRSDNHSPMSKQDKSDIEGVKLDIGEPVSEIRVLLIDHEFRDPTEEVRLSETPGVKDDNTKCSETSKNKSNESNNFTPGQNLDKNEHEDVISDIIEPEIRMLLIDHEFPDTTDELAPSKLDEFNGDITSCGNSNTNEYITQDHAPCHSPTHVVSKNSKGAKEDVGESITGIKVLLIDHEFQVANHGAQLTEMPHMNDKSAKHNVLKKTCNKSAIEDNCFTPIHNLEKSTSGVIEANTMEPVIKIILLEDDDEDKFDDTISVIKSAESMDVREELIDCRERGQTNNESNESNTPNYLNLAKNGDKNNDKCVKSNTIEPVREVRTLNNSNFQDTVNEVGQSQELTNDGLDYGKSKNDSNKCISEMHHLIPTLNANVNDHKGVEFDIVETFGDIRTLLIDHEFQDTPDEVQCIESAEEQFKNTESSEWKNEFDDFVFENHCLPMHSLDTNDVEVAKTDAIDPTSPVFTSHYFNPIIINADYKTDKLMTSNINEIVTSTESSSLSGQYDLLDMDFEVLIHTLKEYKTNRTRPTLNSSKRPKVTDASNKCYKNHLKSRYTDGNNKRFICDYCQDSFRRKDHLEKHMRSHTITKIYCCKYCDYAYTRKFALDNHVATNHTATEKACPFCSFQCRSTLLLEAHLKNHDSEEPYLCKHCDYECIASDIFVIHMRRHTDEKRYSCKHCDYKSKTRVNLNIHMRTHSRHKRELNPHVACYTEDEMYPCVYCNATFNSVFELTKHIAKMNCFKFFTCDICSSKFRRKCNLASHMRFHYV